MSRVHYTFIQYITKIKLVKGGLFLLFPRETNCFAGMQITAVSHTQTEQEQTYHSFTSDLALLLGGEHVQALLLVLVLPLQPLPHPPLLLGL